MAKIRTKIELNEKDLLDILCEKYNLSKETASINVYSYKGDAREGSYTNVTVEGQART